MASVPQIIQDRRATLQFISFLPAFMMSGRLAEQSDQEFSMTKTAPKDWEFFYGNWRVKHRRLTDRLVGSDQWEEFGGRSSVAPLLGGFGNYDDNVIKFPSGDYWAASMRSYDIKSKTWAIWWLDQRNPHFLEKPVIGDFKDGVGEFYSDDTFKHQKIKVRFLWTRTRTESPMWEQAFSLDDGQTWETNWYMEFVRI